MLQRNSDFYEETYSPIKKKRKEHVKEVSDTALNPDEIAEVIGASNYRDNYQCASNRSDWTRRKPILISH